MVYKIFIFYIPRELDLIYVPQLRPGLSTLMSVFFVHLWYSIKQQA